jgi:hypothetical protein
MNGSAGSPSVRNENTGVVGRSGGPNPGRRWTNERLYKRWNEENRKTPVSGQALIRLLMHECRKHPDIGKLVNTKAPGRGAITGKRGANVWDYLRLRGLNSKLPHTNHPHFTLSIGEKVVNAVVALPSSMEPKFRKSIVGLEQEQFFKVMAEIEKNTRKVVRGAKGACPWVSVTQRHHPTHPRQGLPRRTRATDS